MAINFKKIWQGLTVVAKTTPTADTLGEFEVLSTDNKAHFHNGTSSSPLVTETHGATLQNKNISADNNTISDLEVDNLKTGVLNTDLSVPTPTDTELPSALAVKTYVDSQTGDVQADVDDLITLTGVPAGSTDLGTFTGTTIPDASTIKDALQALETAEETTAQGLSDHISDIEDAHDASAISVVPTGNLVANDVQEALVELQDDIDTLNGELADFVVGPASATDNAIARYDLTTGKLIQDSLVTIDDLGSVAGATELSVDNVNINGNTITSTDINGNLNITANGTGVVTNNKASFTGNIQESVSTDSATTGANAALSSPATPVIRLTNTSLTSIDTILSPLTGRVLTIINATGNSITINNNTGATASERILTGTKSPLTLADEASIVVKYDDTEQRWMVIGGTGSGGGQSLDTVFQLIGLDVPLWATGNNATFLGGGSLAGTFVADTVTPLNGISSYLFTQAAGSLNDYIASPVQDVAERFRGQTCTFFFPFKYDGDSNDIEVIFYDVTNATIIPSSAFIQNSPTVSIFKYNVPVPSTCEQIRVGFQVKVANDGAIFDFDDLQLTSDTTVYADIATITDWQSFTPTGTWTTNTNYVGKYRRVGDTAEIEVKVNLTGAPNAATLLIDLPAGLEIDSSKLANINNTNFVIGLSSLQDNSAPVNVVGFSRYTGSTTQFQPTFIDDAATGVAPNQITNTSPITFATGDSVTARISVPIVGWSASNTNILTAPDTFSTDTALLQYASSSQYTLSTLADAPVGTFITFTYAASTNTRTQTTTAPTQTTSDMNANGIQIFTRAYNAASTAAQPATIAIQIGKGLKGRSLNLYKSTGKVTAGELDYFQSGADSISTGARLKSYDEITGVLVIDTALQSLAITQSAFDFSDGVRQSNGYLVINASKQPALTGLNIDGLNQVAVLKDVKANNTDGGSSVATTWTTRALNNLTDPKGIVKSLASNQFTLGPGTYRIDGETPLYQAAAVAQAKSRLRNITDNVTTIVGMSESLSVGSNDGHTATCPIKGIFTITKDTTFAIQYWVSSARATEGLGRASGSGEQEVYTQVEIQKIG